ncbi:hypothetical protein [Pelagovum pacificum]|uniref:Sel1 repeat family protein n=1 Tax=Pelagovum pacificum TaxID=2588711 RepID=A0A5C5G9G7_9RHOB|nr:hypothetical protein [Pelagovum pacificum]QQA41908.1 hypothetical protein I8N54_14025 [Pelagovum pacificum]TNY30652.1 hypothetical protein FHY64_18915 [Pelagovum pacificum]
MPTLIDAIDRLDAGDWDGAHDIAQDDDSKDGAWLHAHIHRVEGDQGNAAYWYSRAGRAPFTGTFEEERAEMRHAFTG